MKTILKTLILLLGFGLFAGKIQNSEKPINAELRKNQTNDNLECRYGQCNATAKSTGRRCLHCVSNPGDLYCYQH